MVIVVWEVLISIFGAGVFCSCLLFSVMYLLLHVTRDGDSERRVTASIM